MSKVYTDYMNETTLTIPDTFIDVKTGESYSVSARTQEQIAYHAKNNTLIHLVFAALDHYLQSQPIRNTGPNEIMLELLEIKKMMQRGYYNKPHFNNKTSPNSKTNVTGKINIKDAEDVIEAFGG
ncbi:hypothetical protein [Virgibacillus ihumii]|uniref:hypothetical protein n=1 Tax=Virgibacillus ihumii TaxID=2686091 RepID=UPI00157D14C3|nr:hypothetical protein [Virgibacillus ihumii]